MAGSRSSEKTCCPKFNPKPFEKKTFVWKGKPFVQYDVLQFFHIPLNMGQVVSRAWKQIDDAGARPADKDFLMLAYDPSPWKSELYFSVRKPVPGARNLKISGTFLSKVFDGPYDAVPKWIAEMEKYAASKGKAVKKHYFYYTTCPKCAKKYGHNFVVAFAQVA